MSRRPTVLTLSVTLVPVTTLFRSSIDAALESSDRALYAAKANGRDCVKTAITASCALLPGFRPCRSGFSREPWGPRQKLAAEAAPATALAGGGIRACYPSDHVLQGRLPMRRPGRGVPLLAMLLAVTRSEEHTSELQSLMRISYAVFCLKKKKKKLPAIHLQELQI